MPTDVYCQIPPHAITFVTRILEGYEYFGVLTTLDQKRGWVRIRSTPDTYVIVREILLSLPIQLTLFPKNQSLEI